MRRTLIILLTFGFGLCSPTNAMEESTRYLYRDANGVFSIRTEEEVLQADMGHLNTNPQHRCYRLALQPNVDVLMRVIDKYLYKLTRHEKYERDIRLGKTDIHTMQAREKSTNNLTILRQAIAIIRPDLRKRSDEELRSLLEKHQTEKERYFGEDLSDNSDPEDEGNYKGQSAKYNDTRAAQAVPGFWLKTGQSSTGSSPTKSVGGYKHVNAGLAGRLSNVVVRHQKKKLTVQGLIDILQGVKKTKTRKLKKPLELLTVDKESRERASLKSGVSQRARDDLALINRIIQEKGYLDAAMLKHLKESKQIITHFYVAQYRGINYMTDRWSADARRYHRTMAEEDFPQYSEVILRTLPFCFYTQLNASHDFTRQAAYRDALFEQAVKLKILLNKLDASGPVIDFSDETKQEWYLFNCISDRLQHRFSNGIDSHLDQLQALRTIQPFWANALPSALNSAIATGDRPHHALKYAFGLKKYYKHPLYPRYNKDGTLEYSHVGKVYASLHSLEDLLIADDKPTRVSLLDRLAQVAIKDQISPEKETSFTSFIPAHKVFYQFVAKYPPFKGNYEDAQNMFLLKYGLNKSLFDSFKYLIEISPPASELRKQVIKLLGKWLCSYHEVLLIEKAKKKAREKNGVLVYINRDGQLSLEADTGRAFTRSDKNAPLRNSIHVLRQLRRELAQQLSNDKTIAKSDETIPGFTVVKDVDFSKLRSLIERESLPTYSHIFKQLKKEISLTEEQNAERIAGKAEESEQRELEVLSILESFYALSFRPPDHRSSIMPPLSDSEHYYEEQEINTLLRNYLRTADNTFTARTLSATHPFIQGRMQADAQQDFINRVREALVQGVPSVIPINLTDEIIDIYTGPIAGNHWAGLIVRGMGENGYHLEYVDSLNSPEQDTDIHELLRTDTQGRYANLSTLLALIKLAAGQNKFSMKILHTEQQEHDVNCGAWLVDNLVQRAQNLDLHNRNNVTGDALRIAHAQLIQPPYRTVFHQGQSQ